MRNFTDVPKNTHHTRRNYISETFLRRIFPIIRRDTARFPLLACNFCTAVYHNSDACLRDSKVVPALAESPSFPWACPACFKKGIAAVQRAVLKPAAQRAPGAKKKRKRGKK